MATAVLLCVTSIILTVFTVVGLLARSIRPSQVSIVISVPKMLRVKIDLATAGYLGRVDQVGCDPDQGGGEAEGGA